MFRIRSLPARFYATPEYREGYGAGALAAESGEPPENPYLPYDLHHLGWGDACYDDWSARRRGVRRGLVWRQALRPAAGAHAFIS